MKTSKLIFLILCITTLFLSSCNRNEKFSIKNDDTISLIEISGNTDSEVFVVLLGQSSSSPLNNPYTYFERELRKTFAIVSYPFLRTHSLGEDCSKSPCSIQELSTDLEVLIKVLSEKYDKKIFLYGNGLAANLALYYSDIGTSKNEISGLILGGIAANLKKIIPQSKAKLIELLEKEISFIDDKEDLEELQTFLNDLKAVDANTITSKAYYQFLDDVPNFNFWRHLKSNCNYIEVVNAFHLQEVNDTSLDLTNHITNIDLPVSLMWWKDEFLVPLSAGEEVFELLQTEDKEMHVYNEVCLALSQNEDEIKAYAIPIIEFIEKYK